MRAFYVLMTHQDQEHGLPRVGCVVIAEMDRTQISRSRARRPQGRLGIAAMGGTTKSNTQMPSLSPNPILLARAISRPHLFPSEPSDQPVPVVVQRQRHSHDNGREYDDLEIVARRCPCALRG